MRSDIKILIIEDEGAIRNLISTALQTNEYTYEVASNGTEALLLLLTHHYDMVLLDLGLPDIDGEAAEPEDRKPLRPASKRPDCDPVQTIQIPAPVPADE